MNMNEHHVHHLAKRLHEAHGKLDQLKGKISGYAQRGLGTLEVGAGAFIGGVVEGRTEGGALFGTIPYNLAAGAALLAVGHLDLAGEEYSEHINNVGNGLLAGFIASKGYAFGQNWHNSGSLRSAFGGGGGGGAPSLPPPVVQGEVDAAQLQSMVDRLASAPAR